MDSGLLRTHPGCLDSETVDALVCGELSGDERRLAEAHIDECPECRRHVSEMAKSSVDGPCKTETASSVRFHTSSLEDVDRFLPRGTSVGRYVVDGFLGQGAMGTVYAAYDPKLHRKVALKMVRTQESSGHAARSRLEREAQAMARLSHPNVVTIYDIGVHAEQLFLAMEFIDGVTLRSWLRDESRPFREVLNAFLLAGQGLAAAHASGLVHRDFKPDNVLCDRRHRVCVTDFGLARAMLGAPPAPESNEDARPESAPLEASRDGSMVAFAGTPAYMAPEQYAGKPLDARSDQFSFCVALYEAIYKLHPFGGTTFAELATAITEGRIQPSEPRVDVPSRVRDALVRGMSPDPRDRFPSMSDLLAVLSTDPAARRRRVLVALGIVAMTVLLAGVPLLVHRHAQGESVRACKDVSGKLAGVWDPSRKAAIYEAFSSTGKSFAEPSWHVVETSLDAYARDWTAARGDACEAVRVRGEQSTRMFDLRMACLDDRLKHMAATTDLFVRADGDVVARAASAVQSLPALGACTDSKALLARVPLPNDAVALTKIDEIRSQLARVSALVHLGKSTEGIALSESAVHAAEVLNYPPVHGEALYQLGQAQSDSGRKSGAEQTLRRALAIADAAGDDATRARALVSLMFEVGHRRKNTELAMAFNEEAEAALLRMGGHSGIEGVRRTHLALVFKNNGQLGEAIREYESAAPLLEKEFGPIGWDTLNNIDQLGATLRLHGDHEAAYKVLHDAVERGEALLGDHHPHLVNLLSTLGTVLWIQLQFDEALHYYRRSLEIATESGGENSQRAVAPLTNTGVVLADQEQYAQAIPYFQRSLAIREQAVESDSPFLVVPLLELGRAYGALGDESQATEYLRRALRLQAHNTIDFELADVRFVLAKLHDRTRTERSAARHAASELLDGLRKKGRSPRMAWRIRQVEQWLATHPPK